MPNTPEELSARIQTLETTITTLTQRIDPLPQAVQELRGQLGQIAGDMNQHAETINALNANQQTSDQQIEQLTQKTAHIADVGFNVVDLALTQMNDRLASHKQKPPKPNAHKGKKHEKPKGPEIEKLRNAVIPIGAAISARFAIDHLPSFLSFINTAPGAGALVAGASSLVASGVRRMMGESAWEYHARYSHIEGDNGIRGIPKKALKLFFHAPERAFFSRMLDIKGSKEVTELMELSSKTDTELARLEISEVDRLAREGLWYMQGLQAAHKLGAHLDHEDEELYTNTQNKVKGTIIRLEQIHFGTREARRDFHRDMLKDLKSRERWTWRKEAFLSAGFGAVRTLVLLPVFERIGTWIEDNY